MLSNVVLFIAGIVVFVLLVLAHVLEFRRHSRFWGAATEEQFREEGQQAERDETMLATLVTWLGPLLFWMVLALTAALIVLMSSR